MRVALLAAMVVTVTSGPSPAPTLRPRPRIIVSATPTLSTAPAYVHARARVFDPGQELNCPTFTWVWGDDTVSSWTPHCDPYQRPEDRRERWYLWTTKPHLYRRPGEYHLVMRVVAGDSTLQAGVRVTVLDRSGLIADGGSR